MSYAALCMLSSIVWAANPAATLRVFSSALPAK